MTKQAFHARIWSKLVAFDRRLGLLRAGDRVLIAVSGGPDSVCLAHYLHLLSQRRRIALRIMHLHHGLRGREADKDARFVGALAAALSTPITQRKLPVSAFAKAERRSLEDAGRKLRYRALLQEARKRGCNKVATGHQLDDQAETVLLNLLRGTRAQGLAGIPPKRRLAKGIEVIRPLLTLRREEVLSYLRHHRLSARTDSSNKSTRFTRNWIRSKALPLLATKNERIREHIASVAEELSTLLGTSPRP